MDHYVDIKVLPDPETNPIDLMNTVYSKLHLVLMPAAQGRVGICFPKHKKTLGDTLRLCGTQTDLTKLLESSWLQGMQDYTQVTQPQPIPEKVVYRRVKRVQAKSAHNKRQRSIAKGWLTQEEALTKIPDNQQKLLTLPYAEITSLSNRNRMRIYIEHGAQLSVPQSGTFSSYGLSASATIPWF